MMKIYLRIFGFFLKFLLVLKNVYHADFKVTSLQVKEGSSLYNIKSNI